MVLAFQIRRNFDKLGKTRVPLTAIYPASMPKL